MGEWEAPNVWIADNDKACLVLPTAQMMILPGSGQPLLVDCVPGKWNVFVPHVPWEQLDERLAFHSLGFLVAHDSWRDEWLDAGAFGSKQLTLTRKTLRLECSNHVCAFADPSVTLSGAFVVERDRSMARRLEIEAMRVIAFDLAQSTHRDEWSRSAWEREAYLDQSLRLVAFPVNFCQSTSVSLVVYCMGALAVRVECRYELPRGRVRRDVLA